MVVTGKGDGHWFGIQISPFNILNRKINVACFLLIGEMAISDFVTTQKYCPGVVYSKADSEQTEQPDVVYNARKNNWYLLDIKINGKQ